MAEKKIELINGKTIEELEHEMYPEEMQEKMQKIRSEYEAFDNHNRYLTRKYNKEREDIEEAYFNKCKIREEANAAAKKADEEEYQSKIAAVNDTLKIIKGKAREGMDEEHIENYKGPLIVDEGDEEVSSRRKHVLKEKISLILKNKAGFRKDLNKVVGYEVSQDTWLVCNELATQLLKNVHIIIYENKSVEYFNASPDTDWHMSKWPTVKDPKEKESAVLVPKKKISKQELVKTLIAIVVASEVVPPNPDGDEKVENEETDDMQMGEIVQDNSD